MNYNDISCVLVSWSLTATKRRKISWHLFLFSRVLLASIGMILAVYRITLEILVVVVAARRQASRVNLTLSGFAIVLANRSTCLPSACLILHIIFLVLVSVLAQGVGTFLAFAPTWNNSAFRVLKFLPYKLMTACLSACTYQTMLSLQSGWSA